MTDEAGNGIHITTRELYDQIRRLEEQVGGMRVDLSNILSENVDLRKRVRGLELRFYGILAGLVAAVVVLLRIGGVNV